MIYLRRTISAFLATAALGGFTLQAADIETVEGEFTFIGSTSTSLDECRRMAVEGARVRALAEKFGTIVAQSTTQEEIVNSKGDYTEFSSLTTTDVRGEWIADIEPPKYSRPEFDDDGNLMVTCRVKGKARALSNKAPQIMAKVLCNGTNAASAGTRFESNNRIYLRFKSPVDGYLAVYLLDADGVANCLLPYSTTPGGQAQMKADTDYLLFSESPVYTYPETGRVPDEYIVYTDRRKESNTLYVVFSPHPFTKAIDNDKRATTVGDGSPRWLSGREFDKWQLDLRKRDDMLTVTKIPITIVNPRAVD